MSTLLGKQSGSASPPHFFCNGLALPHDASAFWWGSLWNVKSRHQEDGHLGARHQAGGTVVSAAAAGGNASLMAIG